MKARIVAGYAVASFILGGTAGVLIADEPRALAQAQAEAPPPAGAQLPWSPRPPGVSPDRWIPISGTLGIVIVRTEPPVTTQPRGTIPQSLEGYFAVRHAGRWWRLRATQAGLLPLAANAQD